MNPATLMPEAPQARSWLLILGSTALPWGAFGCGGNEGEKFVPVIGKVTLDGQPLTVGAVSFRPDAARGNTSMHVPSGDIDRQGNYELVTVGKKGAPPGWYKVLVFADANTLPTGIAASPKPPQWMMNVKYTDPKTTDLSIEVVENPAAERYDLKLSK
ncbi:MAG TPA: hypothetical protein VEL76_17060 [Gemmataceae bacterium]|nr:hypothetical protein [Gemmataceae bacterium]